MRIASWGHSVVALLFAFGLGGAAYAEEGKAEKAGKKLDEAADKTEAAAKKAGKKVDAAADEAEAGVKKAGRATKKAARRAKNKTGEKIEDAGKTLQGK
jgi:hypothetical protein